MLDTIKMDSKFNKCLENIIENSNLKVVDEAWSYLKETEYFALNSNSIYNDSRNYKHTLKVILTKKRIINLEQVASLLQWFSKFIHPNTESDTISNDIAYFLTSSAESFKEKSCLAEIIEVINDNQSIYLSPHDNTNLCHAIIEVLFWMKQPKDLKKYNEDFINIKNFLKMICKQENGMSKNLSVNCFRFMCTIFLKNNRKEDPSSALIIVFQVVEEKLWNNHMGAAVHQILNEISDECKIVQMLSLFCKWIVEPPYTNMKYLSTWLTLFIKNLEKNGLTRMIKEVAEMALPSIFPESLNIDIFYTIDIQSNIVLLLMEKIGSLGLFHKIIPTTFILLTTQKDCSSDPNKLNVVCIITGIINKLLDRFSEHLKVSCNICSKVKKLISNDNNQSYSYQILEESEEMEVCYPSTSNGFGRFNNVKVGLVNLGNTCYMNGVLQALVMTSQFCHEVLLYKNKNELSNQTVLKNLQNLFVLLKYTEMNSLSPTAILYASKPSYFMPGHQQDSSEFLCHLLDVMYEQEKSALMHNNSTNKITNTKLKVDDKEMVDREETTVALASPLNNDGTSLNMYRWTTEENLSEGVSLQRKTQSLADFTQGEELVLTQNSLTDTHSDSTDSGIQSVGGEDSTSSSVSSASLPLVGMSSSSSYLVHRVFGGELKVTYQCIICNTKSDNTDKFRDLQLCFLDNLIPTKEIYVQDLIDMNYFLPENLTGDNKYRCDKCEKLCDAQRRIKILQAPAHLILTLKHFRYDSESSLRTKLRRKVFYNETIQLPVLEKSKETFRLYAAVVHSGYNMDYGHYITYACDAKNRWYKFNDSYVIESSIEEFKSLEPPDTPYILFYKKCGDTLDADAPEFSALSKNLRDYVKENNQCMKDHRGAGSKVRRHATPLYKPDNCTEKDGNDDEDDNPPPSNCKTALNMPQRPCLF